MNLFARITATLGATAETAVSRFENHDAVAQCALIEARQEIAKARIRHRRLIRSVDEIRETIERTETQARLWTERAKKHAVLEEQKAMQCLEQRQLCREQLEGYRQNLDKHENLAAGIAERLRQMEARFQSMDNQRNEMRSRESIARATQVMDRIDNRSGDGVDAVFERWELHLSDAEIRNDVQQEDVQDVSSLQRQMEEEERQARLKDELVALLSDSEEKEDV